MQYQDQNYKDSSNGLHFLSAQDQANAAAAGLPLPDPSWTAITVAQAQALLAPTTEQLWAIYQATAQAALTESDKTILRCGENAVVVPAAWATYRKTLRAIIAATSGDPTAPLPTRPAYPAGT